jgi:hypothetical protein
MNSIHNNGENDKKLDDDLNRLTHAYGQSEQQEPPDLIDQAILNSAHRAVEKKPHWMRFGWLHGLTTAAVFVLAFTLVLKQPETAPVYDDATGVHEAPMPQTGKLEKKQSSELRLDDSVTRTRAKSDQRPDTLRNITAPVPAEFAVKETSSATKNVREDIATLVIDADKNEWDLEQIIEDEADVTPESAHEEVLSQPASTDVAQEPVASELEVRTKTRNTAEQQLLEIVRLKEAGDESWVTELESFREIYPDYPLPEELSN